MSDMHWYWWIFWMVIFGVIVFYGWGRPSAQRSQPREMPRGVLQRRLPSGEIALEEDEEHNALLDRDADART